MDAMPRSSRFGALVGRHLPQLSEEFSRFSLFG
jgi:hypothetical protein